jgi:hypothetical protein
MHSAADILEKLAEQPPLSADELSRLPRWALVALAVRCARRAQPLFTRDWRDAPLEYRSVHEQLLELTEASAATATAHEELPAAIGAAGQAATTAANLTARFASFTVIFAAINAANSALAETNANAVAFVQSTIDTCQKAITFGTARFAAHRTADFGATVSAFMKATRSDYNRMLSHTRVDGWIDSNAVAPSRLGALWPEGPPPGLDTTTEA